MRRWTVLPLLLVQTVCTVALATSGTTQLSGIVTLSPVHPGPQHAGEPDAVPMSRAVVRVLQASGHEVARVATDDQGRFHVMVAPGSYDIAVQLQGAALPRCELAHVSVRDGEEAEVQVMCDSGIR